VLAGAAAGLVSGAAAAILPPLEDEAGIAPAGTGGTGSSAGEKEGHNGKQNSGSKRGGSKGSGKKSRNS